jgi:hypothetical protein
MPTIMPEGEKLRQAIKWISDCCQEEEGASIPSLIEQAAMRFNLSPKEEDYLRSFYRKKSGQ